MPRSHHRTDVSLAVATLAFRQRPMRIDAEELMPELCCTLIHNRELLAECRVLDVSAGGVGILLSSDIPLWLGMQFDEVRLEQGDRVIAEGPAEIVNLLDGAERRAGLRFAAGTLDLGALRLRDGTPLDPGGANPQADALPADWRAAVAELGQILRWSGFFLDQATRPMGPMLTRGQEQAVFSDFFTQWGPRCLGSLARLHDLSSGFDEEQQEAARGHARAHLISDVYPGDPPRPPRHGIIDDHDLPALFLRREFDDSTLHARFFRYAWARFPLTRTILARPRWLSELWEPLRGRSSTRALIVQPGPAAELSDVQMVGGGRVELTMLEAEAQARVDREPAWRDRWLGRSSDLNVEFRPPSGLPPLRDGEQPYDLIYGAGLLGGLGDADARAMIRALHHRLAPGGRLILGNLRAEPASTWLLDYVLGWPLRYREVQELGALMEEMELPAERWGVGSDPTGRAAVIDLTR